MQDASIVRYQDPFKQNAYLGKTRAVLYYCLVLCCIAVTGLCIWLTVYNYQNPGFIGVVDSPDTWLISIVPSLFFLAVTVFLLFVPSLQSGKPSVRIQVPTAEYLASIDARLIPDPKARKQAIRSAPPTLRRMIRVCQWTLPAIFTMGFASLLLGKMGMRVTPLSWFESLLTWASENDAMFTLIFGIFIVVSIVQTLCTRRALRHYMDNDPTVDC